MKEAPSRSVFSSLYSGRIGRQEYWFGIGLMILFLLPFTEIFPLYFLTEYLVFNVAIFILVFIWMSSLMTRRANDLDGDLISTRRTNRFEILLSPTNLKKNKHGAPVNRNTNIFRRTLGF